MRALVVLIVSLVLAAPAAAGGWATVGLGPPPPGTGAGDTWNAEMAILQHGQTPLTGIVPTVIIKKGDVQKTFTGTPTKKPGVYVAEVKFPSGGEWKYLVNDGFSRTHSFPAVQVAGGSGSGSSLPVWPFIAAGMALALAVAFFFARRIRPAPAPAAQP
jgi:hypothetical protein